MHDWQCLRHISVGISQPQVRPPVRRATILLALTVVRSLAPKMIPLGAAGVLALAVQAACFASVYAQAGRGVGVRVR